MGLFLVHNRISPMLIAHFENLAGVEGKAVVDSRETAVDDIWDNLFDYEGTLMSKEEIRITLVEDLGPGERP